MKKLSKKEQSAYIDKPNHCPYCKSEDIEAGRLDADSSIITSRVVCNSCNRSWTDVYTLKSISES